MVATPSSVRYWSRLLTIRADEGAEEWGCGIASRAVEGMRTWWGVAEKGDGAPKWSGVGLGAALNEISNFMRTYACIPNVSFIQRFHYTLTSEIRIASLQLRGQLCHLTAIWVCIYCIHITHYSHVGVEVTYF